MNRLYLNIAAAVTISIVLGGGTLMWLIRQTIEATESQANRELDSVAAGFVARLDGARAEQWPDILSEAREAGVDIIDIRPAGRPPGPPGRLFGDGSPREGATPDATRPTGRPHPKGPDGGLFGLLAPRPRPSSNHIETPIHGGHFVVVVRVAPYIPPILPPLFLVTLLVALCTTLVGWPLIRRLRKLDRAIDELGKGNLDVRLDRSTGALGDVAERLNHSAASLQRMFQEREELLQAVSHELGTPISRIKLQLELIREQSSDSEVHRRLDSVTEDLAELRQLSKELVSWLDAGAGPRTEHFEVNEVVETLLELATEFDERGLDVTLDLPDASATIEAEPRLFQRAVENLIRNAVKYTHHRVRVRVENQHKWVTITVEDDGPGIPAADRERIFQPFVRLESSRSRDHGGIGLGMAIAARIINAHGAKIDVRASELGGALIETQWRVAATVEASGAPDKA